MILEIGHETQAIDIRASCVGCSPSQKSGREVRMHLRSLDMLRFIGLAVEKRQDAGSWDKIQVLA